MKKILVNGYFGLNFGDDLFFKILFNRYPNTQFHFYNNYYSPRNYKKYKKVFSKYNNVKVKRYPSIKKFFYHTNQLAIFNSYQFKEYDATVFIGGSIFMESSNKGRNLGEKLSLYNYFISKNKPIFILGSNFGPYHTDEFYKQHYEIFSKCTDVCFREKYSYNLFRELDSVRMNPDIVFSLKEELLDKKKDNVGISVMNFARKPELKDYYLDYENKMIELIQKLVQNGKKITLFSFSEPEGDLVAINRILKNLSSKIADNIKVSSYQGNINEFLNELSQQEAIVSARFHAMILSQVFEQGIYPLVYSNKTLNVLKDIKLDQNYCEIKKIKNLDCQEVLDCLYENKISIDQIKIDAEKQFKKLDDFLKG